MTKTALNRIASSLLTFLIAVGPMTTASGQQKTPPQTDQDEVIRIKTDLVQLRAVVTDKKGQPVDNLKQDDFEILENGRAQPVSFFSAARVENPAAASDASDRKPNMPREQPMRPAANAKPQRSIVLFVDTLHLSPISLIRAKQQLRQFVDEQMTDQDMGAIVTTSSSLGVLQQFMRDRKMLKYAIEKISGFSRPSSFFTPFLAARVLQSGYAPNNPGGSGALSVATAIMAKEEYGGSIAPPPGVVMARAKWILSEETVLRRATLQTVKAVGNRMAELPGQRMIAFMSDGFTLLAENGADHDDFQEATTRAARSGVVIYSFSPQGLTTPVEFTAAAPIGGFAFGNYMHDSQLDQQDTLRDLARVTGGEAYLNSNDVVGQLKKMLDANRIYYAMAYYPTDESDKKFRNIKVRVKNHPEYNIRTQRGYQPLTEKKSEVAITPQQKLLEAMVAPLPLTNIGVTSSADYLERSGDDAQVTLQVHFAGDSFQYPAREEKQALNCEVAIVVFDREGKAANSFSETITAAFTPAQLENARRSGYRYSKRLPLPPGLYQIRIGVRDANSELMGTSMSWVTVPDLHKKKLTLSGIFLGQEKQEEQTSMVGTGDKAVKPSLVVGQGLLKRKEPVFYRFVVYNSTSSEAVDLQLKVEVLESEAVVYEGAWEPLSGRIVRSDAIGMEIGGQLRMSVPPGIYSLRVTIRDPKSDKTVQQTIVLEITM